MLRLIDRERRRAEAGQPAEIVAKMNSLIDGEIIRALYDASRSGVRIRLNVRGICALRPGVPDVSPTIEVVSIVDRFLEHARVYYFLNGGDEEVYLASADWMTRNLDKRIELMFPVEQADHKATRRARAAVDVPRQRQGALARSRRRLPAAGADGRTALPRTERAPGGSAAPHDGGARPRRCHLPPRYGEVTRSMARAARLKPALRVTVPYAERSFISAACATR